MAACSVHRGSPWENRLFRVLNGFFRPLGAGPDRSAGRRGPSSLCGRKKPVCRATFISGFHRLISRISQLARPSDSRANAKMILTNCAACAAPLAHDAPRCVRCKLRYCDSTCQYAHAVRRRARRPLYRRVQARQGWTAVCERVLGSELFYEHRNSGLNPEPQSLLCGISDTWRSYP